jgi:hypothetical protein
MPRTLGASSLTPAEQAAEEAAFAEWEAAGEPGDE